MDMCMDECMVYLFRESSSKIQSARILLLVCSISQRFGPAPWTLGCRSKSSLWRAWATRRPPSTRTCQRIDSKDCFFLAGTGRRTTMVEGLRSLARILSGSSDSSTRTSASLLRPHSSGTSIKTISWRGGTFAVVCSQPEPAPICSQTAAPPNQVSTNLSLHNFLVNESGCICFSPTHCTRIGNFRQLLPLRPLRLLPLH